jgi:chaperone required for assembly of F1-ATPase
MKRFWTQAQADAGPEGYGVRLDGKPLRLPAGGPPLCVPGAAMAEAIAAEWQQAGTATGEMEYADVPLTRLAGTAQLRIAPDPAPVAAAIAAYGETDLLCYRAEAPAALAARQQAAWGPWLDWARTDLGAALTVTSGVVHVRQHPAAIAALRRAVDGLSAWKLAGLGIVVPALGSLVLGLAVAHDALGAMPAHALSRVDEVFQAELWGEDPAAEARRANVEADILDAVRFMGLAQ